MKLPNVLGLAQPVGPLRYEFPSPRYATDESAQIASIGDILDAASYDATDLATYFRETKQLDGSNESEIEKILEALEAGTGITFEKLTQVEHIVDRYMEGLKPEDATNIARRFLVSYATGGLAYPAGRLKNELPELTGEKVALMATTDTEVRVTWGAEVIAEREVKAGDVIRGFVRNALDLDPITLTNSLRNPNPRPGELSRPGELQIETHTMQDSVLPFGINGPTVSSTEYLRIQAIDPVTYEPRFTDASLVSTVPARPTWPQVS